MSAAKVKNRNWMVTALLAAGVLAYVFLMFLPRQRAIGQVRGEIAQKQEVVNQSLTLAFRIQEAERQRDAARQFVESQRAHLPAASQIPALLAKLSTEAAAAQVKIVRFDPLPAVPYESFHQAPITLECEGLFGQVFEFVKRLEATPALIWVDHLRLERPDEKSEYVRCELNLVIFAGKSDISD